MCPRIRNFTTALKLKRFHLLYSTFRLFFFPQKDSLIIGLIFNPLTSNSQEPVTSYEQHEIKIYFNETCFLEVLLIVREKNISYRNCASVNPVPEEQWIYNKVSWQITPKWNRSYCLQKHLDGYNNGIPIVLRRCQRHHSQVSEFLSEIGPA